jgi:hypothetical protein
MRLARLKFTRDVLARVVGHEHVRDHGNERANIRFLPDVGFPSSSGAREVE